MLYVNTDPTARYPKDKYVYYFKCNYIFGSFAADSLDELKEEIQKQRLVNLDFDKDWGKIITPGRKIISKEKVFL